ncbi:MAG: ABC transporter permease [Bacteroidales bacterium]|nr:ABC transporter permease [Bacteroidales bacterium]
MKIIECLQTTFYNIKRNKGSAMFCIIGAVLTFIFISLIVQLGRIVSGDYPPASHANRTIRIEQITDEEGQNYGGMPPQEINSFLDEIKEYEYSSIINTEGVILKANNRIRFSMVTFTNADFWKMNDFEFIYGSPFTQKDCDNRQKSAIITESLSQNVFNKKNSIGNKIEFQGNEYEIRGVVADFSPLSSPSGDVGTWVPYVFNKFIPSGNNGYTVDVLFPPSMPVEQAKEKIATNLRYNLEKRGIKTKISAKNIPTLREVFSQNYSQNQLLKQSIWLVVLLLLVIPAINIVTLNIANTNNRSEEIAVRRAYGASRFSSFMLVLLENILLVVTGSIIGVLLAPYILSFIQQLIFDNFHMTGMPLLSGIDLVLIFIVIFPLTLVFSLLSGGLPAYFIVKRNIAEVLKGGSK